MFFAVVCSKWLGSFLSSSWFTFNSPSRSSHYSIPRLVFVVLFFYCFFSQLFSKLTFLYSVSTWFFSSLICCTNVFTWLTLFACSARARRSLAHALVCFVCMYVSHRSYINKGESVALKPRTQVERRCRKKRHT